MLSAAWEAGMALALGTGSGLRMGLGVDSEAITPLIEKVGSSGDFGARQGTSSLPMTRLTERVEDSDGSGSRIYPGCIWTGSGSDSGRGSGIHSGCFWAGTSSETDAETDSGMFSDCFWTGTCSEMNS